MTDTVRFERFHEIVINAPAAAILDYVSNPTTWPDWIASSHALDSPARPLQVGEEFHEKWSTRTGPVSLDWRVTAREDPYLWEAQTRTDFTGIIVVRYEIEAVDAPGAGQVAHRYRRRLINPARPKPPTPEMIARIDEEAIISLANIKRQVEQGMEKR